MPNRLILSTPPPREVVIGVKDYRCIPPTYTTEEEWRTQTAFTNTYCHWCNLSCAKKDGYVRSKYPIGIPHAFSQTDDKLTISMSLCFNSFACMISYLSSDGPMSSDQIQRIKYIYTEWYPNAKELNIFTCKAPPKTDMCMYSGDIGKTADEYVKSLKL